MEKKDKTGPLGDSENTTKVNITVTEILLLASTYLHGFFDLGSCQRVAVIFVDLVKEVYDAHVLLSEVEETDGVDIEDGFRVKVFLQFVLVNG